MKILVLESPQVTVIFFPRGTPYLKDRDACCKF